MTGKVANPRHNKTTWVKHKVTAINGATNVTGALKGGDKYEAKHEHST